MRYPHGASRPFTVYLCLLVSYALLISLLVPSVLTRVSARSVVANSARASQDVNREAARAGELLIKFRAGTAETDKNAVALSHGVRRSKKLRGDSDIEKLDVPAGLTPEAFALQLASEPAVEFAEPNFLIARDQFKSPGLAGGLAAGMPSGNPAASTLQSSLNQQMGAPGAAYLNLANSANFQNPQNELGPTDPRFNEQWALRNTGQSGGSFGSDIGVTAAWQTMTGSQSTIIAIIDSGIDFNHPDLANNQWSNSLESINGQDDDADGFVDDAHGWDWVANNGAGSNVIKDEQGHGTAVAGIIGAQGDNAIGVSGVMWRAGLMSLRVLDNTGAGDVGDAVEAIDYAVAHGAQVINLSWGTAGNSVALKDAIERAVGKRD
jgi:subtilisin family serine protease